MRQQTVRKDNRLKGRRGEWESERSRANLRKPLRKSAGKRIAAHQNHITLKLLLDENKLYN